MRRRALLKGLPASRLRKRAKQWSNYPGDPFPLTSHPERVPFGLSSGVFTALLGSDVVGIPFQTIIQIQRGRP